MSAAVCVVPRMWAMAPVASAARAVNERKGPHRLRLVEASTAALPAVPSTRQVGMRVRAAAALPVVPASELAFYRKHTEGLLRRYVKLSMEAGRVPSMLNREMFRGKVTSYRVRAFDDVVIFTHDVEWCLETLGAGEAQLIRRIALQEYTQGETAATLGLSLRTVVRRYAGALDRLTAVLLEHGLLEVMGGDAR